MICDKPYMFVVGTWALDEMHEQAWATQLCSKQTGVFTSGSGQSLLAGRADGSLTDSDGKTRVCDFITCTAVHCKTVTLCQAGFM